MTIEERAIKASHKKCVNGCSKYYRYGFQDGYIAGAKENGAVWHKVFDREPNPCEYWELPQDRLPKKEDFYFVKLKNGYIKICELKYDSWSRKKYFYDLGGPKQSNVAEWLAYPQYKEE